MGPLPRGRGLWSRAGFPGLSPPDFWVVILCHRLSCALQEPGSVSGLRPLDAGSTPSPVMTVRCLQTWPSVLWA